MLAEDELDKSILAAVGNAIAWIFKPLGWGEWQAAVASITGLVAKENIVGTLGILYGGGDETVYQALGAVFTQISGYSFLVFNLLCAPCFAAIGATRAGRSERRARSMSRQSRALHTLTRRVFALLTMALPFCKSPDASK